MLALVAQLLHPSLNFTKRPVYTTAFTAAMRAADELTFDDAMGMGSRAKRSAVAVVLFPFALCILYHLLAFLGGTMAVSRPRAAQMNGACLGDGLADAVRVRLALLYACANAFGAC
jgi:hypothetical protein